MGLFRREPKYIVIQPIQPPREESASWTCGECGEGYGAKGLLAKSDVLRWKNDHLAEHRRVKERTAREGAKRKEDEEHIRRYKRAIKKAGIGS